MQGDAFERLRERLAHVDPDQGWFFARIAEQVTEQRKARGLSQKVLVLLLSLWIGARSVGMDISLGHLAAATVSAVLLAIAYGAVALLLGAATGRRTLAIGVTAAAAVAAYLVNGLAPLVDALEIPRKLSPFYHYAAGDPLRHGLAASHSLVLVAIVTAATMIAPAAFARRDLSALGGFGFAKPSYIIGGSGTSTRGARSSRIPLYSWTPSRSMSDSGGSSSLCRKPPGPSTLTV